MKKITAKFIVENLNAMAHGEHIHFRGAEYWMACDQTDDGKYDTLNGVIYWISAERASGGSVNGREYGKVINGVAYRI